MNLAAIAVDDDLVALVRTRLNFTSYPDTMNALYSRNWINMDIQFSAPAIEEGLPVMHYYFSPFPRIEVPEEIASYEGDASVITYNEYILAFMYNFVTANPNGFNELVDSVVEDVLGPRLDAAVQWLHNLSGSFSVSFTWDMFTDGDTPPLDWPRDQENNPAVIKIGKEELLMEAASLQTIRSLITLFRSYNYTLPLLSYYTALNPVNGTWDFSNMTTPLVSGFLCGKTNAAVILNQAKASMQAALTDMLTALNGMLSDRPGMLISSTSPVLGGAWDFIITDYLNYAKVLCTKIQASVNNGEVVIIPVPNSEISVYFDTYSDAANWPTVSDWGDALIPPTAIGINYGKIYSGTIFAIDALLELQSAGDNAGEPVWYRCEYTAEPDDIPFLASSVTLDTTPVDSINPAEDGVLYAFKVKDFTLGGLLNLNAEFIAFLRTLINGLTGDADLGNDLVVENEDGSVSLYVPQVPPCFAYESFADADETFAVNYGYMPETQNYTTKGSFWWSIPELVMFMKTYIYSGPVPEM